MTPREVQCWELAAGDEIMVATTAGTFRAYLECLEVLPSCEGDARTGTWVSTDGRAFGTIDLLAGDTVVRVTTRDERAEANRKAFRDAERSAA